MEYVLIANAILDLLDKLLARGKQTGALTDQQTAELRARADGLFAQYGSPAPPPPGVTP